MFHSKTRLSLTPTNVRIDSRTPTRQISHQQSIQSGIENSISHMNVITGRVPSMRSDKENIVRVQGHSFIAKESAELIELRKQKENMCYTLAETLKKNQQLKQALHELQIQKEEQQQTHQSNLDQFVQELNNLHNIIQTLEEENTSLCEQNENQQWQIQQLQSQFNVTQNFGSG